jgi:hypothetical protein
MKGLMSYAEAYPEASQDTCVSFCDFINQKSKNTFMDRTNLHRNITVSKREECNNICIEMQATIRE